MSRAPLPDRESIPDDEREDYDFVYQRVLKLTGRPPEDIPYVGACLNSPPFAASLWKFSGRMLAVGSTGDSFSHQDRAHINIVLGFDFGYYTVIGSHLGYAVEHAGLRSEMVRALWEGRDDDLTDAERQLVDYIRAYVDGRVTDEMWSGIVARFGSVRGAVEYTLTIGYHLLCARCQQAFDIPSISREEMQRVVQELGAGEQDYRTAGIARGLHDPELLAEMSAG
jgi:hypothetical protein